MINNEITSLMNKMMMVTGYLYSQQVSLAVALTVNHIKNFPFKCIHEVFMNEIYL